VEVDQVVAEIPQLEPFLLIVGTATIQAFVCCEQGVFIESQSVKAALMDLIMTYLFLTLLTRMVSTTCWCFFSTMFTTSWTSRKCHPMLKIW